MWGRSTGADEEELDCPLRFPGQYHDAETGLNYNLARYYDPDTASLTGKRITRIYDDKDYKMNVTRRLQRVLPPPCEK